MKTSISAFLIGTIIAAPRAKFGFAQEIVDILPMNPDLSTLVAAIEAADLVDLLFGDGPFTVFAPTNAAFGALPDGVLDALLVDIPRLTDILLYHVVGANTPSSSLTDGPVETLNGATVEISTGPDVVFVDDAKVVEADILANNGIIHVVDKVILPMEGIGTTICSCAPSEYEFTLNFDLTCDNSTVGGPGVAEVACEVDPSNDSKATDFIPVRVSGILLSELDQRLQISKQKNTTGNFVDGDTFNYTSIAALRGQISDPNYIPAGILLMMDGVNHKGEQIITNTIVILFSISCTETAYPVLSEGQSIGWVTLTNLGTPLQELCPIAAGPTVTMMPSASPSDLPSDHPSLFPSGFPTVTKMPSASPSDGPSHSPSGIPTLLPSSIVDMLARNSDSSTLVAAMFAAGLVDDLFGDGPFTVFAPTDDAFDALPDGVIDALLEDIPALRDILLYHVVGANTPSSALTDGLFFTTLNGADVEISAGSEGVFVNDANIVGADILANNGIIHVIDKVILPPMEGIGTAPACNEYPPQEAEAQTKVWNYCMMLFPDVYDDYCIQGDNTEELMMKVACFLSATKHSTDYRKRKKGQEIKICSGQYPITFPFVIGDSTFTGFRITNDVKITCKTSYDSDGEETCELARGGTDALSFCPVLSIECLDTSKLYIKTIILPTGSNVIGHGNCIDGTRRLQSSNAPQDVKIKSSSKVSGKGKGKGSSSRSSRRSRRRVRGGKDVEPRRRALFEDANATNASLPFCMDPFFDDENIFEILEDAVDGDAAATAATEETVPTSHLCKIARLSFNKVDPLTDSMDLMAAVTSTIPKGAFMVHHKTIWSTILNAFDANGDGEVSFDETVTMCDQ